MLANVSYLSMATDVQRYKSLRDQFDAKVYVEQHGKEQAKKLHDALFFENKNKVKVLEGLQNCLLDLKRLAVEQDLSQELKDKQRKAHQRQELADKEIYDVENYEHLQKRTHAETFDVK